MADAGIVSPADVHFVQIKCPLLTKERIEEATRRGAAVATEDTYHSMALSRGASALGVAVALGEVPAAAATEAAICRDWSLFSRVASTSAGVELLRNEVIVLGNAAGWAGDLLIDHDVMKDAIDADAARRVLGRLGGEVVAVLAKAEASPSGEIRGRRHTMLDDSDIHSHAPRPRAGGRRPGRRDRRHAALCLRRRRAPGPRGRRAGRDHRKDRVEPRRSPVRDRRPRALHAAHD